MRGVKPIVEVYNHIGGWPIIDGVKWNESSWDWERSILNFRQLITKQTNNPFSRKSDKLNEIDKKVQ